MKEYKRRDRRSDRALYKQTNAYKERRELVGEIVTGVIVFIGFSAVIWVPCFIEAFVEKVIGF